MGSISRYIFRTTLGAVLVVLVSLTAVIWVTQALRDIDIMTSQGQTLLVFIGVTGLIIPLLVLVIAPIALLIAVAHVLNKMSNDSEIIVMNAAGMSPWILFRAFMAAAIVVSLLVCLITAVVRIWFCKKGSCSGTKRASVIRPWSFSTATRLICPSSRVARRR
jgi:lipopolysaccharide export system permease protein